MEAAVSTVLTQYGITPDKAEPLGGGLINHTFKIWEDGQPEYILQRVNTSVFTQPEALMENLLQVLPHLQGPGYRQTEVMRTRTGHAWVSDPESGFWRVYRYIQNSRTYPNSTDPSLASEAGRILGQFHQLLRNFPARRLQTTLPGFHDLEKRVGELEKAAQQAVQERARQAAPLVEKAETLIRACRQIPFASFPIRVCHNDPVMKNILYREDRPEALCLIDLDTIMPGLLLWDFGDAVRSVVTQFPEDYRGPEPIVVDTVAYSAFVRGFTRSGVELTEVERQWLPWGLVLMPLLHGIRALADFLAGDVYYQTSFEGQNLIRAKNLMGLAGASLEQLPELELPMNP